MKWTYQNKEVEGISDFPNETFGFVYRIVHTPTGKAYIGKKVLQHTRKVKLTKKELKLLSEEDIKSSKRLACQTIVNGNISVSWKT